MFKKYVGLDFLDVLIHAGVTIAACVMLASIAVPDEEVGVALGFGASLIVLAWRRKRALATLREFSTGEVQTERVLELEARVADLEHGQSRVLELEERLDFTERMLAQRRELQPGRPPAGFGD